MALRSADDCVVLAPSCLGWMALAANTNGLQRLTFGYPTPKSALAALPDYAADHVDSHGRLEKLTHRFQRFLEGHADDFLDVQLDLSERTDFQRAVIECCRHIPRGETLSYGALAARSGSPRAARAVGSVMANNCFPLVVPCHRVIGASSLGGFSSPKGMTMKRRLLELEGALPNVSS